MGPELRPLLVRMLADDPQVRPTAAEAALALYRVAVPEPVVLVGHHPDPAAAVTNRIRRAAAETRSRSQLRAMESAEQKRVARARRRDLVARHVTTAFRVGARPRAGVVTSPEQEQSRSVRRRVGLVVVVAVLLAAGMMSLMRLAEGSTAETSLTLAVADTATAGTGPTEPTGSNSGAEGAGSTLGRGGNGPAGAVETSAEGPVAELGSNPAAALQRVADARAAALSAADPVALLRAEPAGTTAYEADSRVIARLRAERQRYVSLRFTVRSAEMVSSSAGQAVVRAQVDREGCTVAGEDGSSQVLPAQPGSSLRYSLALVDGEWRITDVASG